MDNKPIKVSDWSQPIKIGIFVVFFVCIGIFAFWFIGQINEAMELLREMAEYVRNL